MPNLGAITKDRHSHTLMWQRCERCGKERWVRCIRGIPEHKLCVTCHGGGPHPNSKKPRESWVTDEGYVVLNNPLHPQAWKNGGIRRSRFILEQALGRPLKKGMVVHHINGNVQDDRPENLMELSRQEHSKLHRLLRNQNKQRGEDCVTTTVPAGR